MNTDNRSQPADQGAVASGGFLDAIERIGNRLPDPTTLFLIGALLIVVLSDIAARGEWTVVQRLPDQVVLPDGTTGVEWRETGETYTSTSLLTRDGLFWVVGNMVENFMRFPPLGVVLVGMLGIGVAERTGMIRALLKAFMMAVPGKLLTPAMVFIGIMSSMALDAGLVILPPLAAALYKTVGRSPLAGLAAVFAGVSAGFNANLFVTGLDPLLAGLSTAGAQTIDAAYQVAATCNWYFMIASTVVMTLAGWIVTASFVERRLAGKPPEEGGPAPASSAGPEEQALTAVEKRGMARASLVFLAVLSAIVFMILWPGAPLYGTGRLFDRWVEAIVPLLLFCFILPGIVYGISVGAIKNDKDAARQLIETIATMAPIIVLAFFAAQFIAYFQYSGLGRMLAMAGGQALGQAQMPAWMLIITFIIVTMAFNLLIGSMSAKYALFAPIFIPMFMMVGISPELTQAAYRIGDSVSNTITPLNPYLVIILVFMRQYVPKGGMGTLISTMLPYTVVFAVVWTLVLVIWMAMGLPLGPGGGLVYVPG